ncbi:MAG: VOC family protein [Bacteroidota bacterium]
MISEKESIGYKVDTLRIFVRDLNEAMAFYQQGLGIAVKSFDEELGWAELDMGEGITTRLEWVYPFSGEFQTRVGRFLGISLAVGDLQQAYEKLSSRGVIFIKVPQKHASGTLVAHLQDPSGNVLTLIEK